MRLAPPEERVFGVAEGVSSLFALTTELAGKLRADCASGKNRGGGALADTGRGTKLRAACRERNFWPGGMVVASLAHTPLVKFVAMKSTAATIKRIVFSLLQIMPTTRSLVGKSRAEKTGCVEYVSMASFSCFFNAICSVNT
jgi:hypothetical protein